MLFSYSYVVYNSMENPGRKKWGERWPKKGEGKRRGKREVYILYTYITPTYIQINILNYMKVQRGLDMFFLGAWEWPNYWPMALWSHPYLWQFEQ